MVNCKSTRLGATLEKLLETKLSMKARVPLNTEIPKKVIHTFIPQIKRALKSPTVHIMSIRSNGMAVRQKQRLWIGMVEVRSLGGHSEVLGDTKGAFVNIVTWASEAAEYKRKVDLVIGDFDDLFVSEVVNSEPVHTRRKRIGGRFEPDLEEIISRARGNPNAIIYGTFHTFERDDS